MAKKKETDLVEEIREEEPLETKGPLRDEPEPAYSPAWEVVNDRQNILADKIPPKIYSLEALMAAGIVTEEMLTEAGYVKNTDYASADNGGVIKISAALGTAVNNGVIQGSSRTLANYSATSNSLIISKGTLENIKAQLIVNALAMICDPEGTAVEDTEFSAFKLVKHGGVYTITYTTTPPTP